jgi:hypothetical protein
MLTTFSFNIELTCPTNKDIASNFIFPNIKYVNPKEKCVSQHWFTI